MPHKLRSFFDEEIASYKTSIKALQFTDAWYHLERAHIIGQRYPFAHNHVHWLMLLFGFKIKNWREVIGQLPRLIFGGVKSFIGTVPIGNPGGANVPALKSFDLDADIQAIFAKAQVPIN